nr:Unknown Function [uncultured bacterium]
MSVVVYAWRNEAARTPAGWKDFWTDMELRVLRVALIAFLAGLLMGCSPEYNWREVSVGQGAVKAFFPDQPATRERQLDFSGHKVQFGLTSVELNDAVFAVAYVPFPASMKDDTAIQANLTSSIVGSLYGNLGVAAPADLPESGHRFVIEGKSPKGPMHLEAIIWRTPRALVEAIVTAAPQSFPGPQAEEFLRGLQVAR